MQFDRHTFPAGGWQWFQPQTRWSAPTPISSTFDQTVVLIIKHRLANPEITRRYSLATDSVSVGNELEAFNRARLGIPETPKSQIRFLSPQGAGAAVAAEAAKLKKVAYGTGPILEWLTSAKPGEAPPIPEQRAAVCVSCPKNNTQPAALTDWAVKHASELLRKTIESRSDLKLETSHDANLGICDACQCPLKTKIHCPSEIVLRHLKPQIRAELWSSCWILRLT